MKKHLLDLTERVAATFAQAFLAIEVADQSSITQLSALKVGVVAGAFAAGKFLLVRLNAYLATPAVTSTPTLKL